MPWELDNKTPIYLQLVDRIEMDILSGHYRSGSRLPSVRDLASEANVNPNTIQKALVELERNGLLHSERTSGRFVTTDQDLIRSVRERKAREEIKTCMEHLQKLQYTLEEMKSLWASIKEEGANG